MASAIIRGMGDYYAAADGPPPDLTPLVKETLGSAPRRMGRFIQLALIGAGRALKGASPDTKTGVYLCSGRGDMGVTTEVMQHVYLEGMPPRPLSFINTVSNTACFFVAKQFGLSGRSSFICNHYLSFESALQLALLDMEMGLADSALVGSVDIVLAPLGIHRRRLRLAPDTPVAEAAHWLWITAAKEGEPGPRIERSAILDGPAALDGWVANVGLEHAQLALGQFLGEGALAGSSASRLPRFDYRGARGYYDTQSAAAPSAFLSQSAGASLVHVNADAKGHLAAFVVRRG